MKKSQFKKSFVKFSLLAISGAAVAAENAEVLPKGVFRARSVFVVGQPITTRYNESSDQISLVEDLNRKLTAKDMANASPQFDALYSSLNKVQAGLGDALIETNLSATAQANFRRQLVALEYGASRRLTFGIIVPVVSYRAAASLEVSHNNQSEAVKSQLASAMGPMAAPLISGVSGLEKQLPTVAAFEQSIFLANGYELPNEISYTALGDLEMGAKFQAVAEPEHRLSFQSGLRLPTASRSRRWTHILDQASGDGQLDTGLDAYYDYLPNPNLRFSSSLRYTLQFSATENRPVPAIGQTGLTNLNDPLSFQNVNKNLGDMVDFELGTNYSFGQKIYSVSAAVLSSWKGQDRYTGPSDQLRNYAALETNTGTFSRKLELGAGYSTISQYQKKNALIPMELKLSWTSTLAARNALNVGFTRFDAIFYF